MQSCSTCSTCKHNKGRLICGASDDGRPPNYRWMFKPERENDCTDYQPGKPALNFWQEIKPCPPAGARGGKRSGAGRKQAGYASVRLSVPEPIAAEIAEFIEDWKAQEAARREREAIMGAMCSPRNAPARGPCPTTP